MKMTLSFVSKFSHFWLKNRLFWHLATPHQIKTSYDCFCTFQLVGHDDLMTKYASYLYDWIILLDFLIMRILAFIQNACFSDNTIIWYVGGKMCSITNHNNNILRDRTSYFSFHKNSLKIKFFKLKKKKNLQCCQAQNLCSKIFSGNTFFSIGTTRRVVFDDMCNM